MLSLAQVTQEGIVSYMTSDNVYVRFNTTEVISVGDTLLHNEVPCLEVIKKSSTSCICQYVSDCIVEKNNIIIIKKTDSKIEPEEQLLPKDNAVVLLPSEIHINLDQEEDESIDTESTQSINARTSIATYSNFSPFGNNDRHQLVGRASINIDNISNSKISFQSYLNYRQNLQQEDTSSSINDRLFRVYNLALSYDIDSTSRISVGRKINRNLSSIGAIDGIQFEKQINTFVTGAVLGFRPDFFDLGFNPNLFEYGAFIGNQFSTESIYSRITLGFLEQRNAGNIDRRYLHFQNIQTINRNLHLFGSMEFDLYSNVNDVSSFKPRLTNLFLSTRYRFSRKISMTLSYDNRKRIIFYETFRSQVEDLLDDDIARQGVRLRLSIRPISRLFAGMSLAKRFQSDSGNKSDNLNAFVSLNRCPIMNGTLSIRYNRNVSNYLKTNIYSSTFSFDSFQNRLNTQIYFRNVQYNYFTSENTSVQNYFGANFYLRLTRLLRFGLLLEVSDRQDNRYYRMNTKLVKRFN
jgi:hypothetical protein